MRYAALALVALLGLAMPAGAAPILATGTTTATILDTAASGFAVTPLGGATLDTSGSAPQATIPITGGTENADGTRTILHAGSGLGFAAPGLLIDLYDFVLDTAAGSIAARVVVNGSAYASSLVAFDLAPDLSVSLTAATAALLNSALSTSLFNGDAVLATLRIEGLSVAVPAPAALALLLLGVAATAAVRRRG
jgi:hypothetical protein